MTIKVWTTGWDHETKLLKSLQYVRITSVRESAWRQSECVDIVEEIQLSSANQYEVAQFFKKIAKYCSQLKDSSTAYTQFRATTAEGQNIAVKWFWIQKEGSRFAVKHDSAFNTIIVSKEYSSCKIILTPIKLNRRRFKTCKNAYSKNKRDAYKITANLIQK